MLDDKINIDPLHKEKYYRDRNTKLEFRMNNLESELDSCTDLAESILKDKIKLKKEYDTLNENYEILEEKHRYLLCALLCSMLLFGSLAYQYNKVKDNIDNQKTQHTKDK